MKVVSAYRPFAPESAAHRKLGAFDWVRALQMLRVSVERSCRCQTVALTDGDTDLPEPSYRYATSESRLMLWILDVCLAYLKSDDFDDDTVMISPDLLVFGDLSSWFRADLGVVVRTQAKFAQSALILNQVQFWRRAAQDKLVRFYEQALALARTLPEKTIVWGADTVPLVRLLEPITVGLSMRDGLSVYGIDHEVLLHELNSRDVDRVEQRRRPDRPAVPIVDFKCHRKWWMAGYFDALIGQQVSA